MSKSKPRRDDYDYDEDRYYENGYYDKLRDRRKLKRMKNALRSRSIDDLIDDEED